jgi:hypothetical protein
MFVAALGKNSVELDISMAAGSHSIPETPK